MPWTTDVDRKQCMGSGICAGIAPDLFHLDGMWAEAVKRRIDPDERALDAADSCPAMAILVREDDRVIGPRP
ncbi:ferredoxin [Streptomyces sp. DT24]|uniref:ferredoxin n=1 Tax=unclassified Streptomyces TaxID=2593676 RepID=UPI003CE72F4A